MTYRAAYAISQSAREPSNAVTCDRCPDGLAILLPLLPSLRMVFLLVSFAPEAPHIVVLARVLSSLS